MRTSLIVMFAAAALALPVTALAKGPDQATISGPGISGSIPIDGDGEGGGTATPLGALVIYGGYFTQMFGHHPDDPTTTVRPAGDLGPRYRIVYSVPTPSGRSSIEADVYPYAVPRAVTYMKPGQPFFDGMLTHGGWYVARPGLRQTLVQAGLPNAMPVSGGGMHVWRWVGIGAIIVAGLGAVAALLLRRRPQTTPAPAA